MADAAAHLEHVVDVLRRHRLSVDAFDADQVGTAYALGWQDAATDWLEFAVDLLEDRCSPFDQPTPPAPEEAPSAMPDSPTTFDQPTPPAPEEAPSAMPDSPTTTDPDAAAWAIVELFGHVRLAGRVQEVERFGGKMLRLDIPGDGDTWLMTQDIGPAALYRVTYVDEPTARRVAAWNRPEPIHRYELPARAERVPPVPAVGPPDGYWDPEEDLDEDAGVLP